MSIIQVTFNPEKTWTPVSLPGSKSIAARAMVSRYVQGLDTDLVNLPECDDTRELRAALSQLEAAMPDALARIREFGELPPRQLSFHLGNGGTSLRFFVALAASIPGLVAEVDCAETLRRRPLAPLIEALRRHGAEITCLGADGYAPLLIHGRHLEGGRAMVDGNISSQFLSAMMLASPLWKSPLIIDETEHVVSRPYVDMTRRVMEQFAGRPSSYVVEADWSAASYIYELALAVPGRPVTVTSLTDAALSLQGDSLCQNFFNWLGVETRRLNDDPYGPVEIEGNPEIIGRMRSLDAPVSFNLAETPDLVPALSAGLCAAGLPFDFGNIAHLRHKECDRLSALATELAKAGYAVTDGPDSLSWTGRRCPVGDDETFEAWNDHRMAMSLSILATCHRYMAIRNGMVVTKSFPDYYTQLSHVGFTVYNINK